MRSAAQNREYWRLLHACGINDDTRRQMLMERYRALSSRALSRAQFADLLNWLKYLAREAPVYVPALAYGGASVNQVRMIERLEDELEWSAEPERLEGLLRKLAGKSVAADLDAREAGKVIEALKSMARRQQRVGTADGRRWTPMGRERCRNASSGGGRRGGGCRRTRDTWDAERGGGTPGTTR